MGPSRNVHGVAQARPETAYENRFPVSARSIANKPKKPSQGGRALLVPNGAHGKPLDHAAPPRLEEISGIAIGARLLGLDQGLYALSVAKSDGGTPECVGILLPAVHLSTPPSNHLGEVEIIAADGKPTCWLGCEGGTAVIKAPPGGGQVLLTTYERRGQLGRPREITVRRIDLPTPELVEIGAGGAVPAASTRDIMVEVLLHIEGTGDRLMPAEGWIGNRGRKLRLEAFSIRPLEALAPADIEYKAYGPDGRETPWISNGRICGTRGLSLPLTGFAIRVGTHLQDRVGIEYHGAFFESGICGPFRNGKPCMARIADDPLEAVKLRFFERADW